MAQQTVEQLGWTGKQVISVQAEQPAIEVMALMSKENISAVAVISGAGRLMGNFSMSDLRCVFALAGVVSGRKTAILVLPLRVSQGRGTICCSDGVYCRAPDM